MDNHTPHDPKDKQKPEDLMIPKELPVEALFLPVDPATLDFQTTDEIVPLEGVIGQPRAIRALELGSEVSGPGYNIFILGAPDTGRTTLSEEYLNKRAAVEPVPPDWCYVNNFDDPRRPRALRLPAGQAIKLRKDMQDFIEICRREIPKIFESDEYIKERDRLLADIKKEMETEFSRLQELVGQHNFILARTPVGIMLGPAVDGRPIKPEELEQLSQEERSKIDEMQARLSEEIERSLTKSRESERVATEQISELNSRTILYLITPRMNSLRAKYSGLGDVLTYFENVQSDMIKNVHLFQQSNEPANSLEKMLSGGGAGVTLRRYEVNVLVDNSDLRGSPVIVETQPTYQNLLGTIEHEFMMGASRTDFNTIRSGAFHRANGGYLILSARDVLVNPFAWEGIKRVLRDNCLRIIELSTQHGILSTVSLEPEPIPLDIKVILVGTPMIYYLLRTHDEDFNKLFKVKAEFATNMDRTRESEKDYSLFVKMVLDQNHLPPFDRGAIARIIEYSSRLADDQEKLSTQFGMIIDLIRESAHWAKKAGEDLVSAESVQTAIDESIYRSNLLEERIQELISQGILMIDVDGKSIGQVNGLSVISLGDYSFGRPNRLTASVHPGQGGVVDIERQAKLGGRIHTKGVLIINGLLGSRYTRNKPLSLTAHLTFEQSYEEVEGDSASAAEMFALLSAIAGVPLRQDRAVTGSVNQQGQIQPIGGVNQKIEGFFATCKAKGLTGEQGVLVPATNQRHLMLRNEVIDAVRRGEFHIWPIKTLDEGLALLSDLNPGQPDEKGNYPKGSFNALVNQRLEELAQAVQQFSSSPASNGREEAIIEENRPQ
jgi:lon-related putative ATP-dependent protease